MSKTKEPVMLKIADTFVKPFLDKDLNYPMIREILKLKLTLDRRRIPAINSSQPKKVKPGQKPKEMNRSMLLTSLLYMFMGLFFGSFQALPNLFVANVFGFGALMFILLSVYVSEYSAVLLDTTEKPFFAPLPLGKRELSIAKDIHIAYYIGLIALSAMLPSIIAAFYFHGLLYGVSYILIGSVVVIFCLHLAGALYFLLLKLFSGEKLKDILNGFQVFVTIAITLSYQILPRVIRFSSLPNADFSFNYFMFALPSAWFASVFGILFDRNYNVYYLGLALTGLLVVLLLEFVYRKKIMKEFDEELEKLSEEAKENKVLGKISGFFCKVFSKDRQEKAFMELVLIQISRDRNLKMKLFPQLANAVILPIIFMLSEVQNNGFGGLFESIRTKPYFLALYAVGVSSAGIYTLIGQEDNKESKLFYQILPIPNLSKCIRAGVKVVIFKYLSPLFFMMAIFFLAVSGPKILFDVFIIFLAFLFVTGLTIRMSAWVLPFSTETIAGNAGYQIMMFFMNFIISGGFGVAHFFLIKALLTKILATVLLIGANLILWKLFMNKKYVIARD